MVAGIDKLRWSRSFSGRPALHRTGLCKGQHEPNAGVIAWHKQNEQDQQVGGICHPMVSNCLCGLAMFRVVQMVFCQKIMTHDLPDGCKKVRTMSVGGCNRPGQRLVEQSDLKLSYFWGHGLFGQPCCWNPRKRAHSREFAA